MSLKVMEKAKIAGLVTLGVTVLITVAIAMTCVGKNDDQNWQVLQFPNGTVKVIDQPGWYMKWFGNVWTWNRSVQKFFSASADEGGKKDESIRVTFNDGGTAQISTMVRYQTPVKEEDRRKGHRDFSGSIENMTASIRSHLINCCKASAPLMSASEHQSARKSEFTQLVHAQMAGGLYEMRKVEKELRDRTDEHGKPITVFATEIVTNEDGTPKIAQKSPLEEYGITILQFSVTGTDYDQTTRAQFEAKKASFLAAEKSKAEREQEVQQRLMIIERGLREKAEVEAIANKEKASATIRAEQERDVAELEAMKKVTVAKQERLEQEELKEKALIEAARAKEVAEIMLLAAQKEGEAKIVLAEAKQKEIDLAGFITEKDRVLAEIAAKRDAEVAKAMAEIKVPHVVFSGSQGATGGSSTMEHLINLKLMEATGILDSGKVSVEKAIADGAVQAIKAIKK